jgi:hypothetical protein
VCGSSVQDREILQLAVGRLVRELVDAMSECGTIPTLFLYSGHDATIMPLSGTSFSVLLLMNIFELVAILQLTQKFMTLRSTKQSKETRMELFQKKSPFGCYTI